MGLDLPRKTGPGLGLGIRGQRPSGSRSMLSGFSWYEKRRAGYTAAEGMAT